MKKKGGVVVNVASAAALREVPDAEVYAATKSAVYHFTRSLGHLSKQGIRVVAICPSAVPTPLWRSLKNIPTVGKDEQVWKRMEERADKLTVDDIVTAMMFAVDMEDLAGVGIFIHGKGKIDVWAPGGELGRRLRGE
jgi:NAD(P)-dependent dehydrogenase (short-subunit alcohol dehydrogenase family)